MRAILPSGPYLAAGLLLSLAMLLLAGCNPVRSGVRGVTSTNMRVERWEADPVRLATMGTVVVLPFADNSIDCITIAFGLRNVTDKAIALQSMLRVLRPGGRLLVLEFSKPTSPLLGKIYDQYSFQILPAMGRLVAQDADSYRYLAESIRKHPDQETLLGMMEDAGFVESRYHNMTGGVVAVHQGFKA